MKKRKLKKPFKVMAEILKTTVFCLVGLSLMVGIFFGAVLQTSERIETCGYGEVCD